MITTVIAAASLGFLLLGGWSLLVVASLQDWPQPEEDEVISPAGENPLLH